jgi:Rieske Fe-S protein
MTIDQDTTAQDSTAPAIATAAAPGATPVATLGDRQDHPRNSAPGGVSRRVVSLGGIGMAAVSVGLAACSSPASSASPDKAPSPSADDSGDAGAGAGAAAAPIVALADVPVGGAVAVDVDGAPYVVAQPEAGSVVAFTAICTHQGCKVAPAGAQLNCPCHGSQFDAFTGEVLQGPAEAPLTALAVAVDGDDVVRA